MWMRRLQVNKPGHRMVLRVGLLIVLEFPVITKSTWVICRMMMGMVFRMRMEFLNGQDGVLLITIGGFKQQEIKAVQHLI